MLAAGAYCHTKPLSDSVPPARLLAFSMVYNKPSWEISCGLRWTWELSFFRGYIVCHCFADNIRTTKGSPVTVRIIFVLMIRLIKTFVLTRVLFCWYGCTKVVTRNHSVNEAIIITAPCRTNSILFADVILGFLTFSASSPPLESGQCLEPTKCCATVYNRPIPKTNTLNRPESLALPRPLLLQFIPEPSPAIRGFLRKTPSQCCHADFFYRLHLIKELDLLNQ